MTGPAVGAGTGPARAAQEPGPTEASLPGARPADPWFRRIDWEASIWVVLLLAPILAVARSGLAWPVRAGTCTAILAFIALYLHTVNVMPAWTALPEHPSVRAQVAPVSAPLLGLVILALATAPVLGWWTGFFLPYLMAIVLFATPLVTGVSVVMAVCTTACLAALGLSDGEEIWPVLGSSASCAAITIGRISAEVDERRRSTDRQLAAATEREEISRDVHDLLGHSLTVLTLKAEVAQRLVRLDPERAEAELAEIVSLSRQALADVRATVSRLRTPDLAGQMEASRTAFAAAGLRAAVSGRVQAVPLPQREVLSWALREATTNVLRHAGASQVEVELEAGRLRVRDDGVGLRGRAAGNGLSGLRRRVEGDGGELRVLSPLPPRPGSAVQGSQGRPGTELEVEL
ncbi:Sensor histidine kinase desK [Actinomyces howellii]|uniref:Sensor histidine kinase desK n=1 Tax=Actinomyces howellii TaxID=52771 RepID=A0A448HFA0_9ACTO|nr:Sensor histidine kinase desK [Actinomyces howellii]